jgi:hypothetical protein
MIYRNGFGMSNILLNELHHYHKDKQGYKQWLQKNNLHLDIIKIESKDLSEHSSGDRLALDEQLSRNCFIPLFTPYTNSHVYGCRCLKLNDLGCRMKREKWEHSHETPNTIHPTLSRRELQFIYPQTSNMNMDEISKSTYYQTRLPWIPGGHVFDIPHSSTNQWYLSSNIGNMRYVAGPSSTTDMLLQLGGYFGKAQIQKKIKIYFSS